MRIPLIFISYVVIMVCCIILSTMGHEQVHKIIWGEYGIESNITYFDGVIPKAVTTAVNNDTYLCNDYCELGHNINESIAYNLDPYFLMIGIGLGFIILILELRSMEELR